MSYLCVFLLLATAIKVHSKSICVEDDVSIGDLKGDQNERSRLSRDLSEDDPSSGSTEDETGLLRESGSPVSRTTTNSELADVGSDVREAMENQDESETTSKYKREVCDEILQQLKNLPCDNPVVITCGGEQHSLYPCKKVSSLRGSLSDVDNILGAAEAIVPPLPALPPIQPLPINAATNSLLPPQTRFLQPQRILTEAERRERQKGIFEGLLRFGTVVNHIDSFLTEKGKMIVKGLHRMVASEEEKDSPF